MNDIEEVLELKKYDKNLKKHIIMTIIVDIPALVLTFQILQKTATITNILLYSILVILVLPGLIKSWYNYTKQYFIAEITIFKNILLSIGKEEFVNEETKQSICKNIKQYINNDAITKLHYILKLNINYSVVEFFLYEFEKRKPNSNTYKFEKYIAIVLETSKENTIEKYEKILLEKNINYNFQYYLTTFDNKTIISVLSDKETNILKDASSPIAEFFKEFLLQINFENN